MHSCGEECSPPSVSPTGPPALPGQSSAALTRAGLEVALSQDGGDAGGVVEAVVI